jgi:outer membrane immunogenic protein
MRISDRRRNIRGAAVAALIALVVGAAVPAAAQDAETWNGPYFGLAAGAKIGSTTWTATQLNGGGDAVTPFTPVDATSPRDYDLSAVRLGAYAGYNRQVGPWVFGPELDFGWSDAARTKALLPGCGFGCGGFVPTPGANDTASVALNWDADVTGRAGYLVTPDLLVYGKGGLALQETKTTGACISPTDNSQYCFSPGTQVPIAHSQTLLGFTVGAGLETRLSPNWLLRGEYRFSYFPAVDDTFAFLPSTGGLNNTYRYRLSAQTHIVSVGLAYKF